ncbi:putative Tyrosine/DOPA decarboxylase [Hibiscus syriacus]|uniref:Tyrosine/DOPA decarboxylase n=1 Tax=Hibiscus syriacus TaxID=106335 RepID=A0A6A2XSV8_HIBSY|nr:putative Tyrosine/DOPA decarboxylase [Hibiscus syriacus]
MYHSHLYFKTDYLFWGLYTLLTRFTVYDIPLKSILYFDKMGSESRKTFLPLDPMSFTNESKAVVDFIADYYENVEKYPVRSNVEPGYLSTMLPELPPYCPESLKDILKNVNDCIIPGLTLWQSPNFFAYFQATASTAGFLGEMLCSDFNVVGFNWISSPAATELKSIVLDWMGMLVKLPSSFLFAGTGGGVLHGSTCEAAVCVLAAARESFERAWWVGTFRIAIEDDMKSGLVPLFLCATVGTTPTGAVDPIAELGEVALKYKLWLHVDSAYAGSACICPELRHYLDGVELANSISMNPHKWFLTNMDAVIPLSRRFRALKLWIVIRKHALANLMYHIQSDIAMAKCFEALVRKDERFEVIVPRKFALVCFRLKPKMKEDEWNWKLEAINSSGRAFVSHAVVGGIYVIRCAIGATLPQEHHVVNLWKLIQEKAQSLLTEN